MFHANLLGRAARLVCPVPVVISTIHSAVESSRSSGSTRLRDSLYRLTGPLADATTRVCHTPGRKLMVIPNGVDTARFRPDARGAGKRAPQARGRQMNSCGWPPGA